MFTNQLCNQLFYFLSTHTQDCTEQLTPICSLFFFSSFPFFSKRKERLDLLLNSSAFVRSSCSVVPRSFFVYFYRNHSTVITLTTTTPKNKRRGNRHRRQHGAERCTPFAPPLTIPRFLCVIGGKVCDPAEAGRRQR